MASKKGIKRSAPSAPVVRNINVPPGTKHIVVHVTIGRANAKKGFKMAKSGIEQDPLGGSG